MSTPVVFNAVSYSIPQYNDTGYAQGAGNLSSYLVAISTGTLQQSGGAFTLTADVNFGANFGLLAKYYTSTTATPATAGSVRLAHADTIDWRNNNDNGNLALSVDSSDRLLYNGSIVQTGSGFVTSITGTAHQVIASAATGAVTLSLPQSIDTTSIPTFAAEILTGTLSLTPPSGNPSISFNTTGGGVVTLSVPAAASTTFPLTLPSAQGAANSFLKNDGTGLLSWSAASGNFVSSITGTANQITASASTGAVTLSTPQDIGTSSNVTFNTVTLSSVGQGLKASGNLSITPGVGSFLSIATDTIANGSLFPLTGNTYTLGDGSRPFSALTVKTGVNFQQTGVGTNTILIAPPAAITSHTLTLPGTQGAASTFLQNNGSGVLSWVSPTGSGTVNSGTATHLSYYATSTTAVSDANGATINGSYTFSGGAGALTMSGSTIAMGSNKITGLAAASTSGDAISYAQASWSLGAGSLTGALAMGANKITGLANGTTSTDAAAFGQIFTGFQAPVQATGTTSTSTTSATFGATVITASITPTSASHRIKITASLVSLRTANGANASALATLARGSTNLAGAAGLAITSESTGSISAPCNLTFIDSPATTSSTTYTVYLRNDDAATSVSVNSVGGTWVMILEEIV